MACGSEVEEKGKGRGEKGRGGKEKSRDVTVIVTRMFSPMAGLGTVKGMGKSILQKYIC